MTLPSGTPRPFLPQRDIVASRRSDRSASRDYHAWLPEARGRLTGVDQDCRIPTHRPRKDADGGPVRRRGGEEVRYWCERRSYSRRNFRGRRGPRHLVPRARLLERLDQGAQGPLTVVCAGAGYGKTTLVSSWIEALAEPAECAPPGVLTGANPATSRVPTAWISLDERDSELGLFLRYLVVALQTMFPDACPATSSLLQAARRPPVDRLSATLINEIAALPQDFILVIDDYHRISGTAVPEMFGEFERHWPQPLHLVLISRHMPTVSLPRWRAQGQLTEIRRATCGSPRPKPLSIWNRPCRNPSASAASSCWIVAPRGGSLVYSWPAC